MGYYSGNSGKIQFGKWDGNPDSTDFVAAPVKITSWSMNSSVALLDTTTLGDFDKNSEYGIRTHTGTLSLLYYSDGSPVVSDADNNAATFFINALTIGESNDPVFATKYKNRDQGDWQFGQTSIPVRLRLYLRQVSANERDYLDFEARLSSVSYSSTVNEIVKVEVSFEANGQIRRVNV